MMWEIESSEDQVGRPQIAGKIKRRRRLIDLFSQTGINVVNLTFDGVTVNTKMAKALGYK